VVFLFVLDGSSLNSTWLMGPLEGRSKRVLLSTGLQKPHKARSSRVLQSHVVKKKPPASSRALNHPSRIVAEKKQKKMTRVVGEKSRLRKSKTARTLASRSISKNEAGSLARNNRMTLLERCSVSANIESQYGDYFQKFLSFCRDQGLDPPPSPNTDAYLSDFMDVMFLDGKPVNEGEKILASIEYHHSILKGKLVRSRKALRGWRKERPQGSRLPLPKLVAYGMSMHLLALGKRLQALKLILDFDTYMRPGESQDLVKKNLVIPVKSAGPQYKWYAVVIRDFEDGKPDKVGIYDNSVPLNTPERMWLGPVLRNHVKTLSSKESKIFPFQSDEYREDLDVAAKALGLTGIHPYQCRHGGASDDLSSKVRDFQSVKTRGRRQTDQSVRRYGKIGKIQQLLNHLSKNKMAFCRWSHLNLEKAFKGLIPPRLG